MKDINFFSIYSNKNSLTYKRNRLIKAGILVLAVIIVLYAGLSVWLYTMETKTADINAYLMSEKVQKNMAEYNQAMTSLSATQEYDNASSGLIASMGKLNNLTTETLGIITKSLPVTAKIDSMDYSNGIFSFNVSAPSMQVIAQTVVRLEETEIFDKVILGNVSKNGDAVGFTGDIQAIMKVGEQ
ncbi:MAG TPA: hypothetical protein VFD03_07785 [Clostridia bacterium]|nr:hypothetical protein [Clostridia bacterium]